MGKFRTPSPGDNNSIALRKLLQGCRREHRLYTSLQQREQAVWASKIRLQVKEFGILCMGRCRPLGSLHWFLCTSAVWGWPCFLVHLASCIPSSSSAMTLGGGSILWITVWGALIHTWRPEIADGWDISCLLIVQEMFSFHMGICVPLLKMQSYF